MLVLIAQHRCNKRYTGSHQCCLESQWKWVSAQTAGLGECIVLAASISLHYPLGWFKWVMLCSRCHCCLPSLPGYLPSGHSASWVSQGPHIPALLLWVPCKHISVTVQVILMNACSCFALSWQFMLFPRRCVLGLCFKPTRVTWTAEMAMQVKASCLVGSFCFACLICVCI